eukprot:CAMPEP_0185743916 /NCGR_PEP_ID=MMETSP1174-20130828/1798_1 /TAXON_ID=35687 /ORGANISM="Dictyocha speculum, Strain CCMP1381" /LENGTH=212 /DNA_ID=CAMNT_0028416941 /DNA_START=126 /DNA_END=764 /DNA_ORIENTATION=+
MSAVVYIGHIPHGFYEDQMKGYFSQFGNVRRLRLSRSKKTGNSKGYGFIEFSEVDTAVVVAESMDKYIIADRALVVKQLPSHKVHKKMWKGSGERVPVINNIAIEVAHHHKSRTIAEKNKVTRGLLANEAKKRKRLADLGVEYDFPGYHACLNDDQEKSSTQDQVEQDENRQKAVKKTKTAKVQKETKKEKVVEEKVVKEKRKSKRNTKSKN